VFKTIVHQTLSNRENPEYIENNGPFKISDIKTSYLGEGYYFWDNHIELAHWWGTAHCNNNYIICEAKFEIEESDFCDLVGSRQDQIYFKQIINMLGFHGKTIGSIIELLKGLNLEPKTKGIFPYKAIRGVEYQTNKYNQFFYYYAQNKPGKIPLNPRIIICLITKNPTILKNYKIIFPENFCI
jgi:hypothetical protein